MRTQVRHQYHRLHRSLVPTLALLLPMPALAQTATPDESPVEREAGTIVVTGTRTERLQRDAPVRTDVIGDTVLRGLAPRNLADALEYLPGARAESNCQNCNTTEIQLLGLPGVYNQILFDGLPLLSGVAAVYGVEQVPAVLIDRIEVVKGGASALYGPGAVAGVGTSSRAGLPARVFARPSPTNGRTANPITSPRPPRPSRPAKVGTVLPSSDITKTPGRSTMTVTATRNWSTDVWRSAVRVAGSRSALVARSPLITNIPTRPAGAATASINPRSSPTFPKRSTRASIAEASAMNSGAGPTRAWSGPTPSPWSSVPASTAV